MAPDGRTEGRTDGHGQTYIPPPSAGDNNVHGYLSKIQGFQTGKCIVSINIINMLKC